MFATENILWSLELGIFIKSWAQHELSYKPKKKSKNTNNFDNVNAEKKYSAKKLWRLLFSLPSQKKLD